MEHFLHYLKKSRKHFNNKEKELFQIIANKNVAIVGPSPWLNNKNLGNEIDSHDLIVRINLGIELCLNYKNDFGSRTDILFINQKVRRDFKGEIPKYWIDLCQLKYLFVLFQCMEKKIIMGYKQHYGKHPECSICHKLITHTEYVDVVDVINNNIKQGQTIVHTKCHYGDLYTDLAIPSIDIHVTEFDEALSMSSNDMTFLLGLRAILHMLKYKPNKISIYGFDFYDAAKINNTLKYNDIYFHGYQVLEGSFDDKTKHEPDEMGHKDKSGKQLDFFKKLYNTIQKTKDTELVVDDNLKNILSRK